jgi:hypothetical protein
MTNGLEVLGAKLRVIRAELDSPKLRYRVPGDEPAVGVVPKSTERQGAM